MRSRLTRNLRWVSPASAHAEKTLAASAPTPLSAADTYPEHDPPLNLASGALPERVQWVFGEAWLHQDKRPPLALLLRARLPLLYCGDTLVYVPGIGIDTAFGAHSGEQAVEPQWQPDRSQNGA